MTFPKVGAMIVAAFLTWVLSIPNSAHQAASGAIGFVVIDGLGGLFVAGRIGNLSSSAWRTKLKDKLVCYGLIVCLCTGVGVLANSWYWPCAGLWAVVAGEGISIGETVRTLLALSAAPWTVPILRVLERVLGAVDLTSLSAAGGQGALQIGKPEAVAPTPVLTPSTPPRESQHPPS